MTTNTFRELKNSLLATTLTLSMAAPALTQAVELVEMIGDYQIVKVISSKVCFAAYNGKSAKGEDVTFATYKTKYGDRWQVAGYVDFEKLKTKGDLLTLSFDEQRVFARGVEFSKGKFALPFTEDDDLKNYTKLVESKSTLELSLRNLNDTIVIKLPELGKAREAIDKCLEGIEKPE